MFTGIVEEIGTVKKIEKRGDFLYLEIFSEKILKNFKIKSGESIALNGVCLTITDIKENYFSVEVMKETLQKTNLKEIKVYDKVNLETPLSLEKFLSGHIVQGHIDGVGKILEKRENFLKISYPKELGKYFVTKGSVCVEGVSLTLVDVEKNFFSVHLIPYTQKNTTLGIKKNGDSVNIEVDIIAKYVEKFLNTKKETSITLEFLKENGYL
jgi:riboflavin synthase